MTSERKIKANRENGKKGGRPQKSWSDKEIAQFKMLCAQMNTEEDICAVMGVSDKTLVKLINKHLYEDITGHKLRGRAQRVGFSDAFEKYSANGRMSLRREQFRVALAGDRTMLIWLGKQYLGQRDEAAVEAAVEIAPEFVFDREAVGGSA